MKIKDIINLAEGINYIIRVESEKPFKFSAKTRLKLLRAKSSIKDGMDHYNSLRDAAMREINPNTTKQENGNIIISLEDEKGKLFLTRLEEIMGLELEDCVVPKVSYEDLLDGDNDIPINVLEKLESMIEEKSE